MTSQNGKYIIVLTCSTLERRAALAQLDKTTKGTLLNCNGNVVEGFSANLGVFANRTVVVICSFSSGPQTNQTALSLAMNTYPPALVIFCGVGGGILSGGMSLGDVVIANHIADVTVGLETSEGINPLIRGGSVDKALSAIAHEVVEEQKWRSRIVPPDIKAEEKLSDQVSVGKIIATTNRVETDQGITQKLVDATNRDALALEMESAGCYEQSNRSGVPYTAVRGISDFLSDKDRTTDRYRQPWAAAHAAAVAFELIAKFSESDVPANIAVGSVVQKKVSAEAYGLVAPKVSEEFVSEYSSDTFWESISILHNFGKLPKMNRGQVICARIKLSGTSRASTTEECEALRLEYGATLDQDVRLIDIGAGLRYLDVDFMRKIYATEENAKWLLTADTSKEFIVSLRLEFGSIAIESTGNKYYRGMILMTAGVAYVDSPEVNDESEDN